MALSKHKQAKIEKIIADNHMAFQVEVLGPDSIPPNELKRLIASGKISLPLKAKPALTVAAAHELGVLVKKFGDKQTQQMSSSTFWDYTTKVAPPELTHTEVAAIKLVKQKLGIYITDLGSKVTKEFGLRVVEEDQKLAARRLGIIREEVASGIEQKKTLKQIAAGMRKRIGYYKRDWLKVAATELQAVMEEGKAHAILRHAGGDPLVYKRPRPDACPFCKLLYLDGKRPRVFRLSELSANGSNVNRKANRPKLVGKNATEWQPVLGVVHPWCQCSLHHMAEGFGFDKKGKLVYVGAKKAYDSLDQDLLNHECVR